MRNNGITFVTIGADGAQSDVRVISRAAVGACPAFILMPAHYRPDGTCRHDDSTHLEMREWGYRWNKAKGVWK